MTPSVWLISCFATETKTGGVHGNPEQLSRLICYD